MKNAVNKTEAKGSKVSILLSFVAGVIIVMNFFIIEILRKLDEKQKKIEETVDDIDETMIRMLDRQDNTILDSDESENNKKIKNRGSAQVRQYY